MEAALKIVDSQISDFAEGQLVEGAFACARKDLRTAKNGSAFLSIELRDRSGSIEARAFRDVDYLSQQFDRGDVVWVSARTQSFAGRLQLDLKTVRKSEAASEATAFLPATYRDVEELEGFLEHLAREVYDRDYARLLAAVLSDAELRRQWNTAPCSRRGHHAYLGGLLEHTVAVATVAQQFCDLHRRLNSDLLITAAIVHDIGKVQEFSYGAEIELTDEGRLLGHIQIGHKMLADKISTLRDFPVDKAVALLHCVVTHHGPGDAGLREFESAEALALCRINALDAGVKGALERH